MHFDEWACFALVVLAVLGGLGIAVFVALHRAARRVDDLSLEVLRLTRRVEAAESRSGTSGAAPTAPAAPLRAPVPIATVQPTPPPSVAVPPVAPPLAAAPPAPSTAQAGAVEAFLGGRVLLVVGVVAVLFGLAFFLKLAIEREWIPPLGRIAIGAAAGVAALVAGDRLRARGLAVFGQALMGGGLGALYLCDYFASVRYDFYGRPAAFVVAAAVAALGAVLAVRRSAPFLAWLGFAGAFLAPFLLGRGEDELTGLTAWLLAVQIGVAATLTFRAWPGLEIAAVAASLATFGGWRVEHFRADGAGRAGLALAALSAMHLLAALLPPVLARRRLGATQILAALGALAVGYLFGLDVLFPEHRTAFAIGIVAAAALLAGLAELHRTRTDGASGDVVTLRAFALACVVAAVPVLLHSGAVAPAWSALAVACVVAGSARKLPWIVTTGIVTAALAFVATVVARGERGSEVARFGAAFFLDLTPCVALAVSGWTMRRAAVAVDLAEAAITAAAWVAVGLLASETWGATQVRSAPHVPLAWTTGAVTAAATVLALALAGRPIRETAPAWGPMTFAVLQGLALLGVAPETPFPLLTSGSFAAGLGVAAMLFAVGASRFPGRRWFALGGVAYLFALLTWTLLTWGDRGARGERTAEEHRHVAQIALSVTWAVYGAALVAAGFWRRSAILRWMGIGVFLLTIGKVFLVDLARLDTASRIGSFLALGVLLVAASFLYQRLRRT